MPTVTQVAKRAPQVGHTQQRTNKCVHISYLYQICAKNRPSIMWKNFTFHESGNLFYLRIIKPAEHTARLLWPTILI
jgi:hypothetical protein